MTVRETVGVYEKLEAERTHLSNAMKGANAMRQNAEERIEQAVLLNEHTHHIAKMFTLFIVLCCLTGIIIISRVYAL